MEKDANFEDFARLKKERDLYKRLLELGSQSDLEAFLRDSLELIVEIAQAQQGYLEIHDNDGGRDWWIAHGFSEREIDDVRSRISTGILAKALSTGETVVTPSALLDPEYSVFDSVREEKIEAVLCAPIGVEPPIGALYLQGRRRPGLYDPDERALAETFARHVAPIAHRLIVDQRDRAENDPTAEYRAKLRLEALIGHSPALAALMKQVALAAPVDVSVLLTGDNGTGKSQLARIIHDNSARAGQPFVPLNCAAIPADLLESELFGARRGAFTGADADRPGRVEAAEGGTLLLDEISEIPVGAQAKLLQFLQTKEYYRLGASKPSRADVRIMAASNVDLKEAIAANTFRQDLYYRLNVLEIAIPTLSQRLEDVPELLGHFCRASCRKHDLPSLEVSLGARQAATAADWPGNIRQLEQVAEIACIRAAAEGAQTLEARHLFPTDENPDPSAMTLQEATLHFQAELIRERLEKNDWNVLKTAEQLDVARSHLYSKIKAFGLSRRRR